MVFRNKFRSRPRSKGRKKRFLLTLASLALIGLNPAEAYSQNSGTRLFKNRDGVRIEAALLSKSDNHARIRDKSGREYNVELSTFSDEDQEYIRNWVDPKSAEGLAKTDIGEVMKARGFTGVPFVSRNNHLFITINVEGKDLTFLLDSGAMTSILTPAATAKLGLGVRPSRAQAMGIGGGAEIKGETTAKTCRFEGSDPVEMDFIVMDLPSNSDGLIGSDFFRSRQAMLDYAGETLWLKVPVGGN